MAFLVEMEDAANPTHELFSFPARWSLSVVGGNRQFLAIVGFTRQFVGRNLRIPLMKPYGLIRSEYRLSVKDHKAAFTEQVAQRSGLSIEKAMEKFRIAFDSSHAPRLSALGENHLVRAGKCFV